VTWTCKAIPRGAASANFQYRSKVFRIDMRATIRPSDVPRPPSAALPPGRSQSRNAVRPQPVPSLSCDCSGLGLSSEMRRNASSPCVFVARKRTIRATLPLRSERSARYDDPDGTELPDDAAARDYAIRVIRELQHGEGHNWGDRRWRSRRASALCGKSPSRRQSRTMAEAPILMLRNCCLTSASSPEGFNAALCLAIRHSAYADLDDDSAGMELPDDAAARSSLQKSCVDWCSTRKMTGRARRWKSGRAPARVATSVRCDRADPSLR
jgi:hypothetical protein